MKSIGQQQQEAIAAAAARETGRESTPPVQRENERAQRERGLAAGFGHSPNTRVKGGAA